MKAKPKQNLWQEFSLQKLNSFLQGIKRHEKIRTGTALQNRRVRDSVAAVFGFLAKNPVGVFAFQCRQGGSHFTIGSHQSICGIKGGRWDDGEVVSSILWTASGGDPLGSQPLWHWAGVFFFEGSKAGWRWWQVFFPAGGNNVYGPRQYPEKLIPKMIMMLQRTPWVLVAWELTLTSENLFQLSGTRSSQFMARVKANDPTCMWRLGFGSGCLVDGSCMLR